MVVVECIESPDDLRVHSPQGVRCSWDFGAGGKVFLAQLTPEQVKRMIGKYGLTRYTERSITDVAEYIDEQECAREGLCHQRRGPHSRRTEHRRSDSRHGWRCHRGTHVAMSTAGITDSQHPEFERLVVESADSLSCMMTNGVAAGRS